MSNDNNYILVVASATCELEHRVNERLDTYDPLGGPVAYGVGLVQAMVKRARVTIDSPVWYLVGDDTAGNKRYELRSASGERLNPQTFYSGGPDDKWVDNDN
jgi:hypothetical protein